MYVASCESGCCVADSHSVLVLCPFHEVSSFRETTELCLAFLTSVPLSGEHLLSESRGDHRAHLFYLLFLRIHTPWMPLDQYLNTVESSLFSRFLVVDSGRAGLVPVPPSWLETEMPLVYFPLDHCWCGGTLLILVVFMNQENVLMYWTMPINFSGLF